MNSDIKSKNVFETFLKKKKQMCIANTSSHNFSFYYLIINSITYIFESITLILFKKTIA